LLLLFLLFAVAWCTLSLLLSGWLNHTTALHSAPVPAHMVV
jgi:hypothetical protein